MVIMAVNYKSVLLVVFLTQVAHQALAADCVTPRTRKEWYYSTMDFAPSGILANSTMLGET